MDVTQNEAEARFEMDVDGDVAVLDYRREGNTLVLKHTEVPPTARGKGIGGALAKFALDYARAEKLKVVPRCPFVASYLERHAQYADLTAE